MLLQKITLFLKILTNLKFAIFLLFLIIVLTSIASFIDQVEPIASAESRSSLENLITFLQLNHLYETWLFTFLISLLSFSLIFCTIGRQFPILKNSKKAFFRINTSFFESLPFYVNLKFFYYIKERLLLKIKKNYFFLYQSKKSIYAYKGLIGRFSPMLVHISLVTILLGSFLENLYSYRIQNYFPRGEVFRIQNHVKLENLTKLPSFYVRINDAWPEYKKNIITQFYTNISILDNFGNEIEEKTVLVNHPLFFKNLNFYQTDWNLQSIRVKPYLKENATEYSLLKIENFGSWVTWIKTNVEGFFLILNNFQKIVVKKEVSFQFSFLENLPAAGLFFNFEPTLFLSYFGFAALILTSIFSYFPYNQFWLTENFEVCYLGALTNREKINLDCKFEILIKTIIPPQELSSETSI